MDLLDLQHEYVCMKMFMHSLDGDACKWYFSLPPSIISSLKDFHRVFNEHCKRYFSDEFLVENFCEEYELHNEVEDIDREEFVSQNIHYLSYDLQEDVFSHKHELEIDSEEAEGSPTIIIYDFYKYEYLVPLDTKHNDQLSFDQMLMETSKGIPRFSDLQTKGNGSNHEELDFHRSSIFKVEQ
jgi:hypothetical protein